MSSAEGSWDVSLPSGRHMADWMKRKLEAAGGAIKDQATGWWNDPVGMVNEINRKAGERLAETDKLTKRAFADPKDPMRVTDVDAFNVLTEQAFDRAGSIMPAGIIKAKNAQWLQRRDYDTPSPVPKMTTDPELQAAYVKFNPRNHGPWNPAMNDWVDNTVQKYVKNQMGTEDDIIRKLADQNIGNDMEMLNMETRPRLFPATENARVIAGFPKEGVATTPAGAWWENAVDQSMTVRPAGKYAQSPKAMENNPWLTKTDPNVPIAQIEEFEGLHSDILSKMAKDLNDDVIAGRIRPDQLNKVSVEEAMRRSHKKMIDVTAEEAKVRATANPHKQYDTGFKWVELGPKPGEAADVAKERVGKLLTAEGKTMQNCVGGYCGDVMKGKTKIYSLENPNGGSHVTIEVKPPNRQKFIAENALEAERIFTTQGKEALESWIAANIKPSIAQIKGKQNSTKIGSEYQKMVDDFIGDPAQWGSISK